MQTRKIAYACATTALATFLSSAAAAIPVYGSPTYTPGVGGFQGGDVPVVPGSGVNGSGVAVGYASKYNSAGMDYFGLRPVRWDSSGATEMGNLGTATDGYTSARAYAVNNAGVAVGYAFKYNGSGANFGYHAVRWDASGKATELPNLSTGTFGPTETQAYALNTAGEAVGRTYKYSSSGTNLGNRAVRWDGSGTAATELDNLGTDTTGSTYTFAYAINTAGTAVGESYKYDGSGAYVGQRAVRWDASGNVTELDNLGTSAFGTTDARAYAVNTAGTAVGYAIKYNGSGTFLGDRAVRWDAAGTAATELGHLGTNTGGSTNARAFAVNSAGVAVGEAEKHDITGADLGTRATLWDLDNIAIDLNTLIDPASGWTLTNARAISDTGWISGLGIFDPDGLGGQAAYTRLFLIQVPEPTGFALLGAAVSSLLPRLLRRICNQHR